MNLYKLGCGEIATVGAKLNKAGTMSIIATVAAIGGVTYLFAKKPAPRRGPDMSDVEHILRAKGRNPRSYGW